ncbi:MAG: hypothetical protein RBQ77_05570 [Candidatus Methanomethylophilaceae archaeon]|jgi:hypothetical protein|nr:hypothetical protein [Candidatus Methanomethylophilaceae archaeon]NLF33773.1 hypothetical protein [Thermoplasmatales archaeon]
MGGQIFRTDGGLVGRYDNNRIFRSGHACTCIGRFENGSVFEGSYSGSEVARYDGGRVYGPGSSEPVLECREGVVIAGGKTLGSYKGELEGAAPAAYLLLAAPSGE